MAQKTKQGFCPVDQEMVLAVGAKPNHVLHLLLCLPTVGLWSIVWILVAIGKIGGYRCTKCGTGV